MKRIIKILCICLIVLFTTNLSAKTIYVSYSDEFELTTQYNTGKYWRDNCGASALFMALDYMDVDLGSVEDIRCEIKNQSGWLYTDELQEFLDDNKVDYSIEYIWDENTIIEMLDKGILLMCVDVSKISGKDYNGKGHFFIVTGYKQDSEGCKLEVYDPMSLKIKYYDLHETFQASENWWRWLFLFEKIREVR